MRRIRRPKLQVHPIAFAVLFGFLFTERLDLICALISAVSIHEAGHLLAAWILKIRVEKIEFGLLGARIGIVGLQSYRDEGLLAAAGPAASFLCAALTFPFSAVGFFSQISALSLILGILNLLPIQTFDGGRIADCLLSAKIGAASAALILRWVSFGFLMLLWLFSVYLLLRAGSGISWLGFSASLLSRFFEQNKSTF
ncbi:MAG: hypothetical protein E7680_00650 [Ruminococcaceae bacterium]|nr:hypothetical protein [Oscillospiraceae bacterium]